MIRDGAKTEEIVTWLENNANVSRRTAFRLISQVKGMPIKPMDSLSAIKVTGQPELDQKEPGTLAEHVMIAAQDMRKLRQDAMVQGDGYDPRIAISAASAESQILMAAAKLAREMRDASRDDITMHPQWAAFRTELVEAIIGTEAEGKVVSLFDRWISETAR